MPTSQEFGMYERKNLALFMHRAQASKHAVARFTWLQGHVRESELARLMQANMCMYTIPFMVISAVVDNVSTYCAALVLKAHFQTHAPSLV